MRIPDSSSRSGDRQDITMTPMIDVVFLLLIFFICTASFQIVEQTLPSSVQLELPAGSEMVETSDETEDIDPVFIHIGWKTSGPSWSINGQPCAHLQILEQKLSALSKIESTVPLILDIDPNVPLGDAIYTYDLGRKSGFSKIQFAADASITQ